MRCPYVPMAWQLFGTSRSALPRESGTTHARRHAGHRGSQPSPGVGGGQVTAPLRPPIHGAPREPAELSGG